MIVLDARSLASPLSGIGRYTLNLLLGLDRIAAHHTLGRIIVWIPQSRGITIPRPLPEHLQHSPTFDFIQVPGHPLSLRNQLAAHQRLRTQRATLLHCPDAHAPLLAPCPTLITLHDVIPLACPGQLRRSTKQRLLPLYRAWLNAQARRAAGIITVSAFSSRDIQHHLRVPPERIHVIPNAIVDATANHNPPTPPLSLPQGGEAAGPSGPVGSYLLYVGRRDPYKNVPLLVRAFADLVQNHPSAEDSFRGRGRGLRLVIAGQPDARYPEAQREAQRLNLGGRVVFVGHVDDITLAGLYRGAAALVMPSAYEGFGLPALEAMLHGTPVVAARATALPETCGDAALYFDLHDPSSLTAALRRVLSDAPLADRLREAGRAHAARFTLERFARAHLDLYRQTQKT